MPSFFSVRKQFYREIWSIDLGGQLEQCVVDFSNILTFTQASRYAEVAIAYLLNMLCIIMYIYSYRFNNTIISFLKKVQLFILAILLNFLWVGVPVLYIRIKQLI